MNAALIRRQLRHVAPVTAAIALGLLAFEILIAHIIVAFDEGPGLQGVLDMLPEFLRDFAGGQIANVSVPGLLAFGFQHPGVLFLSVAWVVFAASGPAGDRDEGTLDLFLARPVTRGRYLASTLVLVVGGCLLLAGMALVGLLVGTSMVEMPEPVDQAGLVDAALSFGALLLGVTGIVLLLAVTSRRRGTAVARAAAVLVPTFLIESFAPMSAPLSSIRWISPFHYGRPALGGVLVTGEPGSPWVLVALFATTTAAAFWAFRRRDL